MAKTVRKVFGSLTGEGTVYQTLNELMFVVKEPIRNPKVVKDLTQMYIANPEVLPEVIQVFPVDAKTKKPVDYYSADTVQPGHKFMISGPNDAIVFKALGAYNKSVGALTNKLKYIRFEVINLKAHKETPYAFTTRKANSGSRRMNMLFATQYYMDGGGYSLNKRTAASYLAMHVIAEQISTTMSGTRVYTNGTINFLCDAHGTWSTQHKKMYRQGEFNWYSRQCTADAASVVNFLVSLKSISRGRLELTWEKSSKLMRFYHELVRQNGGIFDFNRIINFFLNNPNKAFGQPCSNCGQLIKGYIDRINEVGTKNSIENWVDIHTDIIHEPNY